MQGFLSKRCVFQVCDPSVCLLLHLYFAHGCVWESHCGAGCRCGSPVSALKSVLLVPVPLSPHAPHPRARAPAFAPDSLLPAQDCLPGSVLRAHVHLSARHPYPLLMGPSHFPNWWCYSHSHQPGTRVLITLHSGQPFLASRTSIAVWYLGDNKKGLWILVLKEF